MAGKHHLAALLVLAFAVVVYLPGLGDEGSPTQKDEFNLSIRTQIEMLEGGHFFTPYLNSKPRFKKPPLVYWAMYGLGALFGTSLFVARLPGLVCSVLLAFAAIALARDMKLGRHKEVLGASLTLTCAGVYAMGRMALLDVPLAMFVAWGVVGFCRWTRTRHNGWLFFSAAMAGLANMTKGPLGPFLVAVVAIARLSVFRQWGIIRSRKWVVAPAVIVFLAISLAWPVAMALGWKGVFLETMRQELYGKRFGGLGQGPLTVIGGILGLMLPWTFFLIAAMVTLFKSKGDRREDWWLLIWLLVGTLPFLLLKSKFERYMVPVVPAAVMLIVRRLDPGTKEGRLAVWATGGFILLAAALPFVPGIWFRVGPWALWLVVLALGFGAAVLSFRRHVQVSVFLYGVLLALLMGVLYPCLGVNRVPDTFAASLMDVRPLYKFNSSRPAFVSLHLNRSIYSLRANTDKPEELKRAIEEKAAIVVSGEKMAHFRGMMRELDVEDLKPVYQWRAFSTRKTFLQFAREGATAEDWRQAWKARALDGLRESYVVVKPERSPKSDPGAR